MYLNFVGYDFNVDNFKVNFDSILQCLFFVFKLGIVVQKKNIELYEKMLYNVVISILKMKIVITKDYVFKIIFM